MPLQQANWDKIIKDISKGNHKSLSRALSFVENQDDDYSTLFKKNQPSKKTPIIGFTGAPGVGKSSLINKVVQYWAENNNKIAVLCIDPSSPFHQGAILGDRLRMGECSKHSKQVFIRSLASKGILGGLNPKVKDMVNLLQIGNFDYIVIETVGVGQSEVDIREYSDIVNVVLVPEGGDIVQNIKSGLMEIGDIYIVNKSDRDGADRFAKNLREAIHYNANIKEEKLVLKTSLTNNLGTEKLVEGIDNIMGK